MKMAAKRTSRACGKLFFILLIFNCSLQIINAQWVQTSNGMGNITINALANSGNNIYAGVNSQGVFLSTNNGANWTQTSLNNQNVSSIAVSGDTIYAGILTGSQSGVWKSTDHGSTWPQITLTNQQVTSLAANGNYVYAGVANNGVYVSTNGGTNWTQAMSGFCFALAVNGSNVFAGRYFGSLMGVYLSTNNGANWTQTSLNNLVVRSLAVNGNNVFAGTQQGSTGTGVYLSTDNGSSWNQTSLNTRTIPSIIVNGNNVFAAADSIGVYVSTDNGTSWIQRNEGLSVLRLSSFTILNNNIFAGTFLGGIYRRPLIELTGIHPISNEIPNQFSLFQNYPNPFNPTTKIKFQIPNSISETNLKTEIRIYDILGNEVAVLLNEELRSGTYEVNWDASNYPSGIYYYNLSTGELSETKKAVLIK